MSSESVKDYYGNILGTNEDLKTSACCNPELVPNNHKKILGQINNEILEKFYGCGSPIPENLEGKTVLDLGCGTGRDVYLISKLVGESGFVIGVDMTPEQLSVAKRHLDSQMQAFGFKKPNVVFKLGHIENLKELGIEDDSVDVVVSNCVINLSSDKETVFSEIFRVLKQEGELLFSDIFASKTIPHELREDPILRGECLSGSLAVDEFGALLRKTGFLDYKIASKSPIDLKDPEVIQKIGMIQFSSLTIQAFKSAKNITANKSIHQSCCS